jgi:predicted phosphodiesterase
MKTRFVCISDTHTFHDLIKMPAGDVLIHSGDFTNVGSAKDITRFNAWLNRLDYKDKIVIAGNHDKLFEQAPGLAVKLLHGNHRNADHDCVYLQDEPYTIGGPLGSGGPEIKIWGSPWTPRFGHGWAFNADRGERIRRQWDMIPPDTDILVTHGPPRGILDWVYDMEAPAASWGEREDYGRIKRRVGCEDLREVVAEIRPKVHVFGHLHEPHGTDSVDGTLFINACICDEQYDASHRDPIVFDFEDGNAVLVR